VVSSCTNGDALDCNGNFSIRGGTLILQGPQSQPEEAMDINGTIDVSGGFLIAGGPSSNMSKAMSSNSSQYGIYATTNTGITSGSIFRIQDSSGNNLVTYKPVRTANIFHFSSPSLKAGSYSIYTGGTCTGTLKDGVYSGGSYSGGTLKKTFTISSKVTSITF
jgi:trimeric autotransporter adhesin